MNSRPNFDPARARELLHGRDPLRGDAGRELLREWIIRPVAAPVGGYVSGTLDILAGLLAPGEPDGKRLVALFLREFCDVYLRQRGDASSSPVDPVLIEEARALYLEHPAITGARLDPYIAALKREPR